jgi:hypothetical protein
VSVTKQLRRRSRVAMVALSSSSSSVPTTPPASAMSRPNHEIQLIEKRLSAISTGPQWSRAASPRRKRSRPSRWSASAKSGSRQPTLQRHVVVTGRDAIQLPERLQDV